MSMGVTGVVGVVLAGVVGVAILGGLNRPPPVEVAEAAPIAVAQVADPAPVDDVAQCHALGYEYCSLDEAAAGNVRDERYTASLPKPVVAPKSSRTVRTTHSSTGATSSTVTQKTPAGSTTTRVSRSAKGVTTTSTSTTVSR